MNRLTQITNVIKFPGSCGRPRKPGERYASDELRKMPTAKQLRYGAQQTIAKPDSPERRHRMMRATALALFEPLALPPSWSVYITAPPGEVAARMTGCGRLLRAALLLQELGAVQLAQRRTDHGTEYLIRKTTP